MGNNQRVLDFVKNRLDLGQSKYKQAIPLNGEGGRNNLKESLYEMFDLVVYLAAEILELEDKKNKEKASIRKSIQPDELKIIFSGMQMLSSKAFEENQIQYGHKVNDLIKDMKESCNWTNDDEQSLRERTGEYTSCIPGSNCD
tara:strand:+ start:101 stop:529 length:429 start_codon:yes stop_codon:yes gene_type:complete